MMTIAPSAIAYERVARRTPAGGRVTTLAAAVTRGAGSTAAPAGVTTAVSVAGVVPDGNVDTGAS